MLTSSWEFPPAKGLGKAPSALSGDLEGPNPSSRLPTDKVTDQGLCNLEPVLRDVLGGSAHAAPRQGPVSFYVFGSNPSVEQKVSLALLDLL